MIAFKGGSRSAGGARSGRGKDFTGLVAYLIGGSRSVVDPRRVAWISYRNLDGVAAPARAAQLMRACADQQPRVAKPVYHFGLSLPASDHLDPELWNQAVAQVLSRLGLGSHQALVIAHGDTDHEHVHVVVNRVDEDGRCWSADFDNSTIHAALGDIELEFGLTRVIARAAPVPELTASAYRQATAAGHAPLVDRVRDQAAADFAAATDWSDLEARLAARGFGLRAATRHAGLLVTDGSRLAALSRVDPAISGPKLAQRFGETFEDHRQAHPDPPAVQEPERAAAPPPGAPLEDRAAELIDRLTRTYASFTEADLHRAAFYQPDGIDLVRAARRSDRVLDLGAGADGAGRYTTRDYLDAEARLLAAAAGLAARERFHLEPADEAEAAASLASRDRFHLEPADQAEVAAVDRDRAAQAEVAAADRDRATRAEAEPLAGGHGRTAPVEAPAAGDDLAGPSAAAGLSAEQRAAVLHATAAADLAQIVGDRDGRSAAAAAIAAAYRERGYEVRGAAPTVHAAARLESAADVRSQTLGDLERSWSAGAGRLDARSVLLLEEAGTLDVRRLGGILAEAGERGAKVVLLGDPGNMQAIGAGDAFRGLLEQHPSVRLDAPRCQREPWQAAASEQLSAGRVAAALDRYEAAGRLHWTADRAAAREELLRAHAGDRRQDPAATRLIVAADGAEAALLNAAVRAERLAAGELGPAIRAGRTDLASGDRIVFRRDDRQGSTVATLDASPVHGVRRGSLGTVVDAERRRVEVRLDDGRRVAFDPVRCRSVAHGYAVTVGQSRAAAADRVYVLADPRMRREDAVVALSRHRDTLDLYADRASFPGRELLDRTLSHPGRRDLAGDYAAADLRRAVDRLQDAAAAIAGATRVERPLREALAAHETLQRARQRVVEARRSLSQPAGQVYAEPATAMRALLRDPAAPARLREGAARDYGALRGRAVLGRADRERAQARHAVPTLTGRLDAYQRSLAGLQAAKRQARASLERIAGPSLSGTAARGLPGAAATPSQAAQAATPPRLPPLAQVRRELARVGADLRGHHQASRGAQDAVETAIRALGRPAVESALVLLPPEAALPVNLAVRAVERALERGPVLGLGR